MANDLLEAVKEGNEEQVTRLLDAHPELLNVVPSQLERNTELANAAPWLVNAELQNAGIALMQVGSVEALTQRVAGLTESVLLHHVYIERRPLIVAAEHGRLGVVRLLIQKGADPRATGVLGMTALRTAIQGGHDEVAAFLLSNGAEGHATNVRDTTLLMDAAGGGHLGAAKLLLHHTGGQGLEDQDDEGQTALSYAAREGHKEVVDYLLSNEARADCRDESGMTPLLMAASAGHTGVVQTIVLHTGAQLLDDKDEDGMTALHHAAADGHDEIVGLLLSRGAHTNSRDVYGNTPVLSASQGGHLQVVQLFLQHLGGLALKERGECGRTALHLASCRGRREVVRCLLLAGADPMIRDDDGRTPRELAEEDAECEAAYDWWEGELQRRYVVYRAVCLHRAYATHRDKPSSVTPYLEARAAAGHALPIVEVVSPQSQQEQEKEQAHEHDDPRKADAGEDELDAVMAYVVKKLNEALLTELLEGFHA